MAKRRMKSVSRCGNPSERKREDSGWCELGQGRTIAGVLGRVLIACQISILVDPPNLIHEGPKLPEHPMLGKYSQSNESFILDGTLLSIEVEHSLIALVPVQNSLPFD